MGELGLRRRPPDPRLAIRSLGGNGARFECCVCRADRRSPWSRTLRRAEVVIADGSPFKSLVVTGKLNDQSWAYVTSPHRLTGCRKVGAGLANLASGRNKAVIVRSKQDDYRSEVAMKLKSLISGIALLAVLGGCATCGDGDAYGYHSDHPYHFRYDDRYYGPHLE